LPQYPFPHCRIEVEHHEEVFVVRVSGELDLAAVPQVHARFNELAPDGVSEVVLDLREVTFMDSSGIGLLIQLMNKTGTAGFSFGVLPGNGQVQSLMRTTGLDRLLPIIDGAAPVRR
jgi:anti-sigma B factor antagonist